MPKMKTNKAAAKRFRKTATGKVKRKKAYLRHILTSKGSRRKRRLSKSGLISASDQRRVNKLIPY